MARMPGTIWSPLPENKTQSKIKPTQVILHTAVDAPGPSRLEKWFARVDVTVESHFWVTLDGTITQMMDTEVRADANRYANKRSDGTGAISVETEDEGDPVGVPWTPKQIISIIKIIRWANETHKIPMKVCPTPSAPGLGYHAMWGAPSAWTPSVGKTCPGKTRIAQFHADIIPALGAQTMTPAQAKEAVTTLYSVFLNRPPDNAGFLYWVGIGTDVTKEELLWAFLGAVGPEFLKKDQEIADLKANLATITKKVQSASFDEEALAYYVIDEVIGRLTNN